MTKQEIYNKVKAHLLKQNEKSMALVPDRGKPVCAYRGDNGMMCAAGILIPDELYSPEMENKPWLSMTDDFELNIGHRRFIQDLQSIHDHYDPPQWEAQLKALATTEGLTP